MGFTNLLGHGFCIEFYPQIRHSRCETLALRFLHGIVLSCVLPWSLRLECDLALSRSGRSPLISTEAFHDPRCSFSLFFKKNFNRLSYSLLIHRLFHTSGILIPLPQAFSSTLPAHNVFLAQIHSLEDKLQSPVLPTPIPMSNSIERKPNLKGSSSPFFRFHLRS